MKKILLSSVALLGMAVAAQAADLPRRTMAPAPYVAAVPVFTWTGFYVGVNAGYGWSDNGQDDRFRLGSGDVFTGSAPGTVSFRTNNDESEGFLGGAQIGYNWQFTPGNGFVVGVETDIQGIDLDRDNGDHRLHLRPERRRHRPHRRQLRPGSQQRQQPRLLRHDSWLASATPSTGS